MTAPRVALYQPWIPIRDEGWTRFVLEQFDFRFKTVHNAEIRAGSLRQRFDCILIPDLGMSALLEGRDERSVPPPYARGIGLDGGMALERFVEQGGTLVLMDSSSQFATDLLKVPVRNVLDGLKRDEFFCPGSLLRIRVDPSHPLGYGFPEEAAAYFVHSQAYEVGKAALAAAGRDSRGQGNANNPTLINTKLASQPVKTVARYSDNIVLLSGWILGEKHLAGRSAVCEITYGKGRIVLFGFRVQFRGQPHNTFKFLFNAIYRSTLGRTESAR